MLQKLPSVLLVDDDPTTNYLNERLIITLGVTEHCLVATNGAEALELLAEVCTPASPQCPSLILLDVNMPVMNGIEFLDAFEQRSPVSQFVIVLLTTTQHLRDLNKLKQLPAIAGLVTKPLTEDKLRTILQTHFNRELLPT